MTALNRVKAYCDNLYYVQPDGTWKKGGDGRSKGLRKEELPKDAVISNFAHFVGDAENEGTLNGINYDQVKGLGAVPDNTNVVYKGFAVEMPVKKFLELAAFRDFKDDSTSNVGAIQEIIASGKPIASPWLDVDFNSGKIPKVMRHEGRTRCEAIRRINGDGATVLVHIFGALGLRSRDITPQMVANFRAKAYAEKSKKIVTDLFESDVWLHGKRTTVQTVEARMPAIEGNSWKMAMRKIAEDHGLKWMGSGAFGSVFSIPSNPEYVLKVFSDRSYLRWVQLCQTSLRGNKYAPQFKGKPVKLYPDRNLWGIRIKRLLPIDKIRTNGTDFVDDLRFYLIYLVTHSLQLDPDYFSRRDVDKKFKQVSDKYEDDEDFWDLTSTLSFYLTLGENYKHFTLDLHYNNVMVDPNTKGYVVVDPLAQSESLAKPFRFKYGKPDVPDTEVPSSMNLRIEDVNSLLLKKGYRVENGSPDEIVYTKSKIGKRRSIRVALKNKVVTDITVELHTPNPNDPWNPTVVKRKVNLEGIKNEAGTTN